MLRIFFTIQLVFVMLPLSAQNKTEVLVLGTYHMSNPGLDAFNMKADDVSTSRRQKEIETFVNLLATFKPTMICLEAHLDTDAILNELYQSYVDGKSPLRTNEIDQIGFRLAKKLNHARVFAIDAMAPFNMDTVVKTAERFQFTQVLDLLKEIPDFIEAENRKLYQSSITQYYQHINSDDYTRKSHALYLKIAVVGNDNNYVGADLVADWYKRNLRIYRNLNSLNPEHDDKVLILFGSGHLKILQDLIEDSEHLQLVKLSELK